MQFLAALDTQFYDVACHFDEDSHEALLVSD